MRKVETSRFEFAHGRRPRGRGYWAFDVVAADRSEQTVFCPEADAYYSNAVRWVLATYPNARRVYAAS